MLLIPVDCLAHALLPRCAWLPSGLFLQLLEPHEEFHDFTVTWSEPVRVLHDLRQLPVAPVGADSQDQIGLFLHRDVLPVAIDVLLSSIPLQCHMHMPLDTIADETHVALRLEVTELDDVSGRCLGDDDAGDEPVAVVPPGHDAACASLVGEVFSVLVGTVLVERVLGVAALALGGGLFSIQSDRPSRCWRLPDCRRGVMDIAPTLLGIHDLPPVESMDRRSYPRFPREAAMLVEKRKSVEAGSIFAPFLHGVDRFLQQLADDIMVFSD